MIISEADLPDLVMRDRWMMRVLSAAEEADLPDWWIGAGFLRNTIWDAIVGNNTRYRYPGDVDLVYFDDTEPTPEADWGLDQEMQDRHPFATWQVRNQARMHVVDGFEPYSSTADGIAHWVETATCVGVRLRSGEPEFLVCYGVEDLLGLIARPIPLFCHAELIELFHRRITEKRWRDRWPGLRILDS